MAKYRWLVSTEDILSIDHYVDGSTKPDRVKNIGKTLAPVGQHERLGA